MQEIPTCLERLVTLSDGKYQVSKTWKEKLIHKQSRCVALSSVSPPSIRHADAHQPIFRDSFMPLTVSTWLVLFSRKS